MYSTSELWKATKWELLDFKGAFFRSIGGDSKNFGEKQNERLPNITGNKLLAWPDSSGGGIIMNESTNRKDSCLYSCHNSDYYSFYYNHPIESKSWYHHNSLGFNASKANSIYGNSAHVTPENYSIKIWKRIH